MRKFLAVLLIACLPTLTFALPSIPGIHSHGIINMPQLIGLYNSAKRGDAFSQAAMGQALINGSIGVLPNYSRGLYWLEKSAKQGCSLAYFNLALLYLQGNGVPRNMEKFANYEKLAVESFNRGMAKREYNSDQLSALYFHLANAYFWGIPKLIKQDFKTALKLYTISANSGFTHAIEMVAFMLRNGLGAKMDQASAHEWIEVLAQAGKIEAQYQTAMDYLKGGGVKKDNEKAIYWLRRSARTGYFPATVKMYQLYQKGTLKLKPSIAQNLYHILQHVGDTASEVLQRNPLIKI